MRETGKNMRERGREGGRKGAWRVGRGEAGRKEGPWKEGGQERGG